MSEVGVSIDELLRAIELSFSASNLSADPQQLAQVTLYLENVKKSPGGYLVGLSLLEHCIDSKMSSSLPLLFAMLLMRFHLSSSENILHSAQTRLLIRQTLLSRSAQLLNGEVAVLNNTANLLTMCIKWDYPEHWPTAFDDLFQLSRLGAPGISLIVKVLAELELEVVVYDDRRTPVEIAHNMIIKDEMRKGEQSVVRRIVAFLCSTVASNIKPSLSFKCMETLVDFIGWIDINLIVNDEVLPFIYTSLNNTELRTVACRCLLEVVKKGMDIDAKIELVDRIGLIPVLIQIPIDHSHAYSDEETCYEQLANLTDTLFLTLIGFWQKVEETSIVTSAQSTGISMSQNEIDLTSKAAHMMLTIFPLLLNLFHYRDISVCCAVMPSFNRYTSLLKQQLKHSHIIEAVIRSGCFGSYFVADAYTNTVLLAIFRQIQYEEDFGFDASDDDDAEEIEAKKEVRKLFINFCRVKPQSCLDLIVAAFSGLTQPISLAPMSTLEASLRLLFAFAECGLNDETVNKEPIVQIVSALHRSDIHRHPHPQVLLAYFDLAVRFVKLTPERDLFLAGSSIATIGLRHEDLKVRCRAAYQLLRFLEAVEGKHKGAAVAFVPLVVSFQDILFSESSSVKLVPEAELMLLEAIGTIAACEPYAPMVLGQAIQLEEYRAAQSNIVLSALEAFVVRIREILSNQQLQRYAADLAPVVAQQIACLASMCKALAKRKRPELTAQLGLLSDIVLSALQLLGRFEGVRAKATVFMHRMLAMRGQDSLQLLHSGIPVLLRYCEVSDAEQIVQLFNLMLDDLTLSALQVAHDLVVPLLDKLVSLSSASPGEIAPPHVEVERAGIVKLYLSVVLHVFSSGCKAALLSQDSLNKAVNIFQQIEFIAKDSSGVGESRVVLMRAAVGVLYEICKAWTDDDSAQVQQLINAVIIDDVLPHSLKSCVDGTLNAKDAQTLGLYADIGGLLWAVSVRKGVDATVQFLLSSAPRLGWTLDRMQLLCTCLVGKPSLTAFREEFKKIAR